MVYLFVGLFLAVLASYVVAAWGYLHPLKEAVSPLPSVYSLEYKSVEFKSFDDVKLSGWVIPCEKPKAVIVLCHGYRSQRGSLMPLAFRLHQRHYAVFMFDYRAHGDSGGGCTTVGYRETDDTIAALKFVQDEPEFNNIRKGLFGMSMGAAAGIMASAKDPNVMAIVADSPFANMHNAIQQRFRNQLGHFAFILTPIEWLGEIGIGTSSSKVSPVDAVAKLGNRPILIIHGEEDSIVPVQNGIDVYNAVTGTKKIWLVPHSEHVEAYSKDPERYVKTVLDFYDSVFVK